MTTATFTSWMKDIKKLVNKTIFKIDLDKIVIDKKAVYDLYTLCRYVHDTAHLFGEEHDNDDSQDRQEFVLHHYDTAIHAVQKATAMVEKNTVMPPCRMCGHHKNNLLVSSVMDDDGFLDEANIHTKCQECNVVFILMKLW